MALCFRPHSRRHTEPKNQKTLRLLFFVENRDSTCEWLNLTPRFDLKNLEKYIIPFVSRVEIQTTTPPVPKLTPTSSKLPQMKLEEQICCIYLSYFIWSQGNMFKYFRLYRHYLALGGIYVKAYSTFQSKGYNETTKKICITRYFRSRYSTVNSRTLQCSFIAYS